MVYFVIMKLKPTYLLLLILFAVNAFSQEKTITIQGKIYSNKIFVPYVHVYNVTKKIGAISNDLGEFELRVKLNDTLYISSLEYEKKTIVVTSENIASNEIIIELVSLVNKLDEVFLRHLTGDLNFDIQNKPEDTIPKHNFKFNSADINKELAMEVYDVNKRPNAQEITDPIGKPGATGSLPDKRYQKLMRLKRELALKKEFPDAIEKELGVDYFTNTLGIEEDRIFQFLSYCEYRDIFTKYYDNKVLEVIEILNEESKTYNALKN